MRDVERNYNAVHLETGESVKLDTHLLAAFIKYIVGEKDIFIIDSNSSGGSAVKFPSGSYEDWSILPFLPNI